jgi:hypothetical protein
MTHLRNESRTMTYQETCKKFIVLLLSWTSLCILSSCGSAGSQPIVSDRSEVIAAPTVLPTATLTNKDTFATKLAINHQAMQTTVALTPHSTRTPGPPPIYPTYTPLLGILGGEPEFGEVAGNHPVILNVWRGWINGGIVQVNAGREAGDQEPAQGVILVDDWSLQRSEVYRTPTRDGAIKTTAYNGAVLTLATIDGRHEYTFDLITRQWSVTGGK